MSTAVLYSGQLRTFAQCYPTQKWQVFRRYEDLHFFFVVQNDAQVNSLSAIQRDYPGRVHIKLIDDPELPEIPMEYGQHAPYANAATHKKLLLQHWYQLQVWEFYKSHPPIQPKTGNSYIDAFVPTVLRMRCDSWMQGWPMDYSIVAGNISTEDSFVFSPWWGRFGGMNDRIAIIVGHKAQNTYFTLYNSIQSLLDAGCPFHPESLLLAHLEKNGIRVSHTLNAIFGTLRLPCPHPQNPLQMIREMRPPEIQAHEIAEYARS